MSIAEKRPELLGRLSQQAVPRHIGIIMDGNGRWAKRRGLPRSLGHKAGVERLRSVVRMASDIGVEVLTVFAFSTENWKRPPEEVGVLMRLLIEYFGSDLAELDANNVRIRFIGDQSRMPEGVQQAMDNARAKTSGNTGLIFNIALNYGGRADIVNAARTLAARVKAGELAPEDITEEAFSRALYTGDLPDVDFVLRTSGEKRVSNFMLYQTAYSELVFTDIHWPDFDDEQFARALEEFAGRGRRFGGL